MAAGWLITEATTVDSWALGGKVARCTEEGFKSLAGATMRSEGAANFWPS